MDVITEKRWQERIDEEIQYLQVTRQSHGIQSDPFPLIFLAWFFGVGATPAPAAVPVPVPRPTPRLPVREPVPVPVREPVPVPVGQ